ncbi:MAG: rhomboid family intramembrane serine protease [Alphaproteobacteria bacterium]|nr:MAG: rhomboid family intramembrane serine protease [Alphaproteobacteria bacterium]
MREPMMNVPPATAALAAVILLVHGIREFLSDRVNLALDLVFGVVPLRYGHLPFDWPAVVAPVTYAFLHGGWLHLGMNVVTLLAFGAGVERLIGARRMLVGFLVTSLIAAAAHVVAYDGDLMPMIGASGGISGLFAIAIILMRRQGRIEGSLTALALVWIGIAVVTGLVGVPGDDTVQVAWVAHVGGFVAGLGIASFLTPPRERRWY